MLGNIKNWFTQADAKRERIAMIIVLFAGAVALLASFVLSIEALVLAKREKPDRNLHLSLGCYNQNCLLFVVVFLYFAAQILRA